MRVTREVEKTCHKIFHLYGTIEKPATPTGYNKLKKFRFIVFFLNPFKDNCAGYKKFGRRQVCLFMFFFIFIKLFIVLFILNFLLDYLLFLIYINFFIYLGICAICGMLI